MNPIPEPSAIVMIGPSGSGKSTLARTWPADYRLELDSYRWTVSGDAGDQEATADAVFLLTSVLERRLARGLTCVIDATHTGIEVRKRTIETAHAHGLPAAAVVMTTSLPQCLDRNSRRPANRRVPDEEVRRQHQQISIARPGLHADGFDHVVTDTRLMRMRLLLQRAVDRVHADHQVDGDHTEYARRVLARRFFGEDLAETFHWTHLRPHRDPIGALAVGGDEITLAYRTWFPDPMDWGFEAQVPCLGGCSGPAWMPVRSPMDLLAVYDDDFPEDIVRCDRCAAGATTREAV
ncbi:ATP/GTP-binding protein [Streptomyces olivaceus]|uniref:AAA family ATPase n=1 Tax=Streptomyces olivaceus TaxID=47716 RepID=UPI0022EE891F|nr:AAA family ATPase [Streptomyces olivaceus]GHI98203.1 ATP/GTP-binding protein [Streptomyces olivaceus]